jgi:hypothetical protein
MSSPQLLTPRASASSRRPMTRPPASGMPAPASPSASRRTTRARSTPPPSIPRESALSRRRRTAQLASGMPRPANRSASRCSMTGRSTPRLSIRQASASSPLRRIRLRASGMLIRRRLRAERARENQSIVVKEPRPLAVRWSASALKNSNAGEAEHGSHLYRSAVANGLMRPTGAP